MIGFDTETITAYLEHGWRPIPANTDKSPAVNGYTNADQWSMEDYGRIAAQCHAPNVGVVSDGQWIALDIDTTVSHNGKDGPATLERLTRELGALPATWTNTSHGPGSPSRHMFYRLPDGYQGANLFRGGAGPGIDIICRGLRHCMVWPSVHPGTGELYEWYAPDGTRSDTMPNVGMLPMLPESWLRHCLKPAKGKSATVAATTTVGTVTTADVAMTVMTGGMCRHVRTMLDNYLKRPDYKNGSRHDSTRDIVHALALCHAEGHTGVPEALEQVHATFLNLVAGDRPGGEREAEAEWARMLGNEETNALNTHGGTDPCTLNLSTREVRRLANLPNRQNERPTNIDNTDIGHTFTMTELMERQFKPLHHLIPGMLMAGTILLVAPPKIGKSWMCMDLAYQLATGGKAFGGIQLEARPVLYMALEDGPRRLKSRLEQLGHTTPAERLSFATEADNPQPILDAFIHENADRQPAVILDTLGKVLACYPRGSNEGAYEHDYKVLGGIQSNVMQVDGASLILVHHNNKTKTGDYVDTVNGTTGIAGAADAIMRLSRQRNSDEGLLQVTSRDAEEGEYAMRFHDGLWTLQGGTPETAALAAREQASMRRSGDTTCQIMELVRRHPEGIRPHQIAEETELTSNKAATYLNRLVKRGLATKQARGVYKPLYQVSEVSDSSTSDT